MPRIIARSLLTALLLIASLALVAGSAGTQASDGRVWVVDPDPDVGDFTTIDPAIRRARNGDTVRVNPGTYTAPTGMISGNITVEGSTDGETIVRSKQGNAFVIRGAQATIRNFTIRCSEFRHNGIVLNGSWQASASGNRITGCDSGINVMEAEQSSIFVNDVRKSVVGIRIDRARNNEIFDNHLSENTFGIGLWNAPENHVHDNVAVGNSQGIHFGDQANGGIVENNDVRKNYGGITAWQSGQHTIRRNQLTGNGHGINLNRSSDNTVQRNLVRESRDIGIQLSDGKNSQVSQNTILDSLNRGVMLWNSSENEITNNQISGNQDAGVVVACESLDNTLQENNIAGNGRFGLKNETGPDCNGTADIDVTNNWWGDPSGPFLYDQHPEGKGDEIAPGWSPNPGDVLFSPWLEEPVYVPRF